MRQFTLKDTFISLRYRNYRLWFIGQLVSLVGTWTQSTAQGYLMYELTQSPAYLGYVGFASGLPSWIFTLYAGAIADRISRRTMILIAQTGMMCLAFILAALTFTDLVQPWHIIILAFLLGICNAFDAPARQAFVVELVERDVLTNAIALNSTMFTSAVVVGPAVGGLAYAAFGPGWCFAFNGISFIAVIISLSVMSITTLPSSITKSAALSEIKEGVKFVIGNPTVSMLISNLGMTSVMALGVITLIPAWAVNVLGGDARTNGWLLSARGLGSLIGALMIAALGHARFRGRLWTLGSFVLPVMMLIFSFIRWLPLSLLAMIGVGWAFMSVSNTTNALVQTQIPDALRGRVMGIYIMVFFGSLPLGSLLAGNIAAVIGEPATVQISALILLILAILVYWRRPVMRTLG
ncbi:MAG: MFS transporter [Anaerolineales bacterium]|nr:MFS transporter [Anaerolineales bacterium]